MLLLCLYIEKEYIVYYKCVLYKDKHMKLKKHIKTYLMFGAALTVLLVMTAGCATAPVEQPDVRVPELPARPIIEMPETAAEPVEEEPTSVVTPVIPRDPEVVQERSIQEEPADAEPAVETAEVQPVEEVIEEEPAVAEADEPVVTEEIEEAEPPAEVTEPEPVIAEAVPEPEPEEVVVYMQADRIEEAHKELQDRSSTAVILSWFGIPILVIVAIILLIEMVRYLVFNKPLFAWAGIERTHDDLPSNRVAQFFQNLGGRFKKIFSRINEKLEEPEDEDYYFEEDKQGL